MHAVSRMRERPLADPRILVLGAGSIGSRHAENLRHLGARVDVVDSRPVAGEDWHCDGYDGVVVASPTSCHADHARSALAAGAHVLVEKPLATSCADLDGLLDDQRVTVGYNLRFHAPVVRLREMVVARVAGRAVHVRLWFGSHLAEWRPGVDYRTTYSARAGLGGGILLDASHELDLLAWIFGPTWTVEGAVVDHRSDLETDAEDVVVAVLRSDEGLPAIVTLDAVSRKYRRGIEVVGDAATLRLDWATGALTTERPDGVETEAVSRRVHDSYVAEAVAFLAQISGQDGPAVPATEAAWSLALCDDIRRCAE